MRRITPQGEDSALPLGCCSYNTMGNDASCCVIQENIAPCYGRRWHWRNRDDVTFLNRRVHALSARPKPHSAPMAQERQSQVQEKVRVFHTSSPLS